MGSKTPQIFRLGTANLYVVADFKLWLGLIKQVPDPSIQRAQQLDIYNVWHKAGQPNAGPDVLSHRSIGINLLTKNKSEHNARLCLR